MAGAMKTGALLRQPFFHFLLGAILIFGLSALTDTGKGPQTITVTQGDVARLAAGWERSWGRLPTDVELEDLIADRIEEEVYFRQARALGLDRDDPFIRKYLRRKMESLTEGVVTVPEPEEAELNDFYNQYPDRFAAQPHYTFREALVVRLENTDFPALLNDLNSTAEDLSISSLAAARTWREAGPFAISREYGVTFYEALSKLDTGYWQGPIASSVGIHVVRIEAPPAQSPIAFEEVRSDVYAAWKAEKRKALEKAAFEKLRQGYHISIERPTE